MRRIWRFTAKTRQRNSPGDCFEHPLIPSSVISWCDFQGGQNCHQKVSKNRFWPQFDHIKLKSPNFQPSCRSFICCINFNSSGPLYHIKQKSTAADCSAALLFYAISLMDLLSLMSYAPGEDLSKLKRYTELWNAFSQEITGSKVGGKHKQRTRCSSACAATHR